MFVPTLLGQLGIADAEGNSEPLGLVEQPDGLRAGHLGFEKAVDLALLREKPARKESGESELGKHDEIAAPALGLAQELLMPAYAVRPRLRPRDRPHLRRARYQSSCAHDDLPSLQSDSSRAQA